MCLAASLTGCQLAPCVPGPVSLPYVYRGKGEAGGGTRHGRRVGVSRHGGLPGRAAQKPGSPPVVLPSATPPGGQRDRCQQSWFGAGQGQAPEGALILRSYGQSGQDRLASAAHVGGWAQVAPPLPPFRGWTQPTIRGQPSEQSQGFLLPWWGSWGPGEAPQGWRGHPRTSGRGGGVGRACLSSPQASWAPRLAQVRGPARGTQSPRGLGLGGW